MTKSHKREMTMTFMCMGLCCLSIITAHWRANGGGQSFFDVLMLEPGFHTFILLSGYTHARESGCGWCRTMLIYALNVAMAWPFQPLSGYLGADYEPRHHGTFNWQRWFLLMVAVARVYTSFLQTVSVPPFVQVCAAAAGALCFELVTHDLWRSLYLEPDGRFFTENGYPWLAKPPYIG